MTKTLEHNLGGNPDNYVVDLQGINVGNVVHQLFYGGDTNQTPTDLLRSYFGFMWQKLTDTSIQVSRLRDDNSGLKVRVRIWVVTKTDFDSGWQPIAAKETLTLEHHLAGKPDEYVVDLQFKTSGNFGVHNRSYGLDTYYQKTGGQEVFSEKGAYWYNLTRVQLMSIVVNMNYISIQFEFASGVYPARDDSGWQDIDQAASRFFPTT